MRNIRIKFFMVLALTFVVGLLSTSLVAAQTPLARISVAHLSPDTPAVEIYVNGATGTFEVLEFGATTGWVEVPAGTYSIAVAPAGTSVESAAIGPANLTFGADSWTTIAAIGSLNAGTLRPAIINSAYSPLDAGETQVTVFHAIEDAPAVDVILPDNTAVVSNLAFGESAVITVPAATYNLRVVPAGATAPAVITLDATLSEGTFYFVAAANQLASPQVVLRAVAESLVDDLFGKTAATQNIAEIAVADGRFDTLVAALGAANLVDTIATGGPFTVFAPTDDAFAKLPDGTVEALLADPAALSEILLYHVVPGRVGSGDVVNLSSFNTLNGSVTVSVRDGAVFLNDNVQVIITDIQATNGVIHVIDTVLIP